MKRKLLSFQGNRFINASLFFRGSENASTTTGTTNNLYNDSGTSSPRQSTFNHQKMILMGIVACLVSLTAIVYHQYNKPALQVMDVAGESVSAGALLTAFSNTEVQANKQYLNKVLQVTGNVTEIKHGSHNNLQVLLDANDPMSTIACTMENSQQEVQAGQTITIKGICTGYLNDVILIKCVLVPPQN
jgi:membrane-associated HD superfamily phosphohydrolase